MAQTVKLASGEILEVIQINGSKRTVQGASRDVLEFVFDDSQSMDTLAATFGDSENTRTLVVNQDGNEYIYNDYVIQVSVVREAVVTALETNDAPEQSEQRIKVSMGQRTYTEKLLEQLLGDN